MSEMTVGRFLSVLHAALAGTGAEVDAFRTGLLRIVSTDRPDPDAVPFGLPVCRWWETALAHASSVEALAGPIRELGPRLCWAQNPNYRRHPPDGGWLDNYGYAVIAVPAAGPPALARHDMIAVGVLLLGPHVHYPLHAHPAREVYVPLGTAEWWRDAGPWRSRPPGAVIHHSSMVPHATRTRGAPLLAIYLWIGDLAVHARLVPGRQETS